MQIQDVKKIGVPVVRFRGKKGESEKMNKVGKTRGGCVK